ncbi:MAG: lysophospholipid acyltransferase family protein [Betaproteobacteria bacterium]|jgi:1-acyl-sn-glycerol-3-phosphate acyltransferase
MSAGVVLRSCLFFLLQLLLTPPYAVIAVLTFPFNALTRYRIISVWARLMMLALDHLCGIKFRVIGAENIPSEPCVILSKHQSAWETFAFQLIFPPQVYVIKRELLWIPFFGWGLAMCSPIAINRGAGPRAARQMLSQGKDRLARGFCVIVYPEGTRVAPGTRGKYQSSGSAIAIHAGVPVLPVAHNAGRCWRRNAFLKLPGTITVSIGPPLNTTGRKADALTREVETWIENEMQQIDHAGA